MLFKLSIRNMKKSFKDYAIYFLTLVLGVAIFYMFNSIDSQQAMLEVSQSTRDIIKFMINMLGYISVFVAVVLGLLIVYANNFLINRRKKEFGIYMTLGMGKRQISKIILMETILVGIISLIVGLIIGIFASQFTPHGAPCTGYQQRDKILCQPLTNCYYRFSTIFQTLVNNESHPSRRCGGSACGAAGLRFPHGARRRHGPHRAELPGGMARAPRTARRRRMRPRPGDVRHDAPPVKLRSTALPHGAARCAGPDGGAAARQHGPRARARHHHQGARCPHGIYRGQRQDLRNEPDRHPGTCGLQL